jgi:hypothetical protein
MRCVLHSVPRLVVIANIVPSSMILVTLMMGAMHSSATLVFTRATRGNIPEDGILQQIACFRYLVFSDFQLSVRTTDIWAVHIEFEWEGNYRRKSINNKSGTRKCNWSTTAPLVYKWYLKKY